MKNRWSAMRQQLPTSRMVRSPVLRTLCRWKCIYRTTVRPEIPSYLPICYTTSTYRQYVSQAKPKKFELPDEYSGEVFHALANNPPVMEAMHRVIETCSRRGITLDREPSISEMWKIMKDKEIIQALNDLSKASKAAGIQIDHILKEIPWSKEMTNWAQTSGSDPSLSKEAIQERIKTIREIISRPENTSSEPENVNSTNPILEKDTTDRQMTGDDEVSLAEIQSDLRRWWMGNEEEQFHERLAKFKAKKANDLWDGDVYDFWIDEWARKLKGRN